MRLRVDPELAARSRKIILQASLGIPELRGATIWVSVKPRLTASRGKLLWGSPHSGTAVHAAAFIRRRQIVLESRLLRKPPSLRLILIHEIFHFAWTRLGNADRREFAALLLRELRAGARGELGESAAVYKAKLAIQCGLNSVSKLWREYVCESFCDTAAWLYGNSRTTDSRPAPKSAETPAFSGRRGIAGCDLYGRAKKNPEFTLAMRWRTIRRDWFVSTFAIPRKC